MKTSRNTNRRRKLREWFKRKLSIHKGQDRSDWNIRAAEFIAEFERAVMEGNK